MKEFERELRARGLTRETTYLFMHGHTLMDNVVMVLLNTVCEKLRAMSIAKIAASSKQGTALRNEMSNYTNSLRPVRDVLLDHENYMDCPLYKRLQRDLLRYVRLTVGACTSGAKSATPRISPPCGIFTSGICEALGECRRINKGCLRHPFVRFRRKIRASRRRRCCCGCALSDGFRSTRRCCYASTPGIPATGNPRKNV